MLTNCHTYAHAHVLRTNSVHAHAHGHAHACNQLEYKKQKSKPGNGMALIQGHSRHSFNGCLIQGHYVLGRKWNANESHAYIKKQQFKNSNSKSAAITNSDSKHNTANQHSNNKLQKWCLCYCLNQGHLVRGRKWNSNESHTCQETALHITAIQNGSVRCVSVRICEWCLQKQIEL